MTYRNHLSPPIFPYAWASDWGEDRYGLWQAFTYKDVRHVFRWIPPGKFDMGSPDTEDGRWDSEDLHHVMMPQGFWLGETAVIQALWQAVMAENSSYFKSNNYPIENISWNDAQTFIAKLNQTYPNFNVRLPWEAEWEYACRAGTQTPFNFGNTLYLDKVNYCGSWKVVGVKEMDSAKNKIVKVKTYPPNSLGLYEMHGNVREWCADEWQKHLGTDDVIFSPSTLGKRNGRNSYTNETDMFRVVRGGSWSHVGRGVRSAIRGEARPSFRSNNLGFRLALGIELQPVVGMPDR